MGKKIINALIVLILFIFSVPAMSKEKEPAVASVAIINYQNKTGSPNYDWIIRTLPDAVFTSMREVFEFKRTDQGVIDTAIAALKKAEFVPDAANMGAVARSTHTDIVISGIYTYDKENNLIEITTIVYHVSRNAITSQIKTESPVNNKMFRIVDIVALKIVEHIRTIAAEDYKSQGKAIAEEKPIEPGKPAKPVKQQKIVLIKAAEKFDYSKWYFNVSNSMIFMFGPLAQALPYGFDLKLNFTNSYKSLLMFGGTLSYAMIFPVDNKTVFASAGMTIVDFRALLGLNIGIKQRVYIQPYIGLGGALEILALQKSVPTGTNPPFKTTTEFQYLGDISMSAGIRFPIRMAGYNMFLTPYVEFCAFPFHNNFISYIQAGVGLSL